MRHLYVITRRDMPPGYQGVQSIHAAVNYCMEHGKAAARWFEKSNYLAWLSVADEASLKALFEKAQSLGIRATEFREPDVDYAVTAIALEPGDRTRRLCEGLPLALEEG